MSEVEYKELRLVWNEMIHPDGPANDYDRFVPANDTVFAVAVVDGKIVNVVDEGDIEDSYYFCLNLQSGEKCSMDFIDTPDYRRHIEGVEKFFIGKELNTAIAELDKLYRFGLDGKVSAQSISEKAYKKAVILQHKQFLKCEQWEKEFEEIENKSARTQTNVRSVDARDDR